MSEEESRGYHIIIKPADENNGTFIRNDEENGGFVMNLDPNDREDLVMNFANFVDYMTTNHMGVKLGCVDCTQEFFAAGNFNGSVGHVFEHDSCSNCGGKLINLDHSEDI